MQFMLVETAMAGFCKRPDDEEREHKTIGS